MDNQLNLQKGDIGAVKGTGLVGWITEHCFYPRSDRFHFFLIGQYLPWEQGGKGDYMIFESIGKGIAVGLLSMYEGQDVQFFRVSDPEKRLFGGLAIVELCRRGRAHYDYFLVVKILLGVIRLTLKGHFPPWYAWKLEYGVNSHLICTEAVNEAWKKVGYPIVPYGIVPLPSEFRRAEMNGVITNIATDKEG